MNDTEWFARMMEHVVNSLASIESSLSILVDRFVEREEDEDNKE